MTNALAAPELDALAEALEDPSHERLPEALRLLSEAASRHMENEFPSSSDFMQRMAELLCSIPGVDHAEPRIEGLLSAGYYFYLLGQAFRGGAWAMEAVDLARRARHVKLRKALNYQAMIDADNGNIPRAIEFYAEALDLARAQGDILGECSVWLNLGVALIYAAQYRDALACFEHARHIGRDSEGFSTIARPAASNTALCCLHLGDIDRGLRAAEAALRDDTEPSGSKVVSRVLRENYFARLLLEAGDVRAACEHAAIAQRYASTSGSLRARIAAAMAQGLCDVYAGRAEAGMELLKRTAEQSRRELPIMLRDVLTILTKAYEFLGMPREALANLQALLDSLRRWQHESALEHVRLHLQTLESGGEYSSFTSQLRSREAQLRGKIAEQDMQRSSVEMLERLAITAELRDDSTGEHCYRLGKLAGLLAHEAGSDSATCERIEVSARLHDIGKNAIPDAIILKRGRLTEAERQIMSTHTAVGADLIAGSRIPQMEMAEQIARHHHDWWDGSKGEKHRGEAIPYAARVVAIADVFDALTHERPHRGAWPIHQALDEVVRLTGTQFDPRLAGLFTEMILRLRREHQDLDVFLGQAAKSSTFLQARTRIRGALYKGE